MIYNNAILLSNKFLFLIPIFFIICCTKPDKDIKNIYYYNLDSLREKKKEELLSYIKTVREKADSIVNNQKMRACFLEKNEIYRAYKLKIAPKNIKHTVEEIHKIVMQNYIMDYLMFYDILFVNLEGDIFYTIRKQADYHKNIFKGELSKTILSKHLKKHPKRTIVDFQNYEISGEASAFFVEPVIEDSKLVGWFVLQYALNKINSMFKIENDLGTTGEIILVNKEHYMVTDSRFFAETTSLKQQLSKSNIVDKFSRRRGHKTVLDYRGYRALTSFDVLKIMNSEWLIIAKMDEDEIITKQYLKNRSRYYKMILENLREKEIEYSTKIDYTPGKGIEVDLDEYRKADKGETIYTHGVSKCTAVIISAPGKFAYLAHISPNDWLYGGLHTDLIHRMVTRIYDFEVLKKDRRKLQIVIVTPKINHTENMINLFIEKGIFLSQLKIIKNPNADYANVYHDYKKNKSIIEWKIKKTKDDIERQFASEVIDVGDIMKSIINY